MPLRSQGRRGNREDERHRPKHKQKTAEKNDHFEFLLQESANQAEWRSVPGNSRFFAGPDAKVVGSSHLLVLAILSYNDLPAEYVSGLSKCQVIGHSLEVAAGLSLLHVDCLEEESFSFHVHSHDCHSPVARCNFCLPDLKMASLVQVSTSTNSLSASTVAGRRPAVSCSIAWLNRPSRWIQPRL